MNNPNESWDYFFKAQTVEQKIQELQIKFIMKNFSCPDCHSKQKFKILLFANNNSQWNCHKCHTSLKFEKFNNIAFSLGFLSTAVPAYIALNILHLNILISLLLGVTVGVTYYLSVVLYFYYNKKVIKT